MSTPIEIVRAHRLSLAYPNAGIATQAYAKEIAALDAVLRDAERFKALERAHQSAGSGECWAVECNGGWLWDRKPLSELADRLREGGR